MSEAMARERARYLSEICPSREGSAAPPHVNETLASWSERWCAEREARGLTSVEDDRSRLRKWVFPVLGPRPIAAITSADLEELVERLDRSVRAKTIAWQTARNVWSVVTKMFADACGAKAISLRVRADDPAASIEGPYRGVVRSKTYLYPTEFLRLVGCERVPLEWRRLFAFATYTYLRAGELEALGVEDIDLERRIIHVHRAMDRKRRATKATKTQVSRRVPIEPPLLPLVERLIAEADQPRLLRMPPVEYLSGRLRQYLACAGCTRAELFATDATRKRIGFHDAGRATGITWMAVRGDDPLRIKQRAGHASFATTEGYIREVENLTAEDFGPVFPRLPPPLSRA